MIQLFKLFPHLLIGCIAMIITNSVEGQGKVIGYWSAINPDWIPSPFVTQNINSNQKLLYISRYNDSVNSSSTGKWLYTDSVLLHSGMNSGLISASNVNIYGINNHHPIVHSTDNYDSIKLFTVTYLDSNSLLDSTLFIAFDTINNLFDTISRRDIEYNEIDNSVIEYRYIRFGGQWNKIRMITVYYFGDKYLSDIPVIYDTITNTYDTSYCRFWKYDTLNRIIEAGGFLQNDTFQRDYFFYKNNLIDSIETIAPGFIGNDRIYVTYTYNLPYYTKHYYYKYFGTSQVDHKVLETGKLYPDLLLDSVWNYYDDQATQIYAITKYQFDQNSFLTDYYVHFYDTSGVRLPYGDSIILRYKYLNLNTPSTRREESIFQLYPNPCTSSLSIYFESNSNNRTDVFIYDQSGRVVQRFLVNVHSGMNLQKIDTSNLPNGTYIISIGSNSKCLIKN